MEEFISELGSFFVFYVFKLVIRDKLEQNHWCALVQTLFGSSTVWAIEKLTIIFVYHHHQVLLND